MKKIRKILCGFFRWLADKIDDDELIFRHTPLNECSREKLIVGMRWAYNRIEDQINTIENLRKTRGTKTDNSR